MVKPKEMFMIPTHLTEKQAEAINRALDGYSLLLETVTPSNNLERLYILMEKEKLKLLNQEFNARNA